MERVDKVGDRAGVSFYRVAWRSPEKLDPVEVPLATWEYDGSIPGSLLRPTT